MYNTISLNRRHPFYSTQYNPCSQFCDAEEATEPASQLHPVASCRVLTWNNPKKLIVQQQVNYYSLFALASTAVHLHLSPHRLIMPYQQQHTHTTEKKDNIVVLTFIVI